MIITKAEFSKSGNEVTLCIENAESVTVSRADYNKILLAANAATGGFPFELDNKHKKALEILEQKLCCIKVCTAALAYGDKSEKALRKKLDGKGFCKKAQDLALGVLKKDGCVDDFSQCKSLALRYYNEKHFGIRRIKQELFKKGYDKAAIENAVSDCDFDVSKAAYELFCVISKKYSLKDASQRQKLVNSMVRYGHDYEVITGIINTNT